ncbi:hypothetical protein FSP39_018897 [Pinctada imbricata]|uniref:Endonuclease n=1 Tax=Pinctada imbricata TaxID=66713 RepID=A0AA88Y081_PINIB|nr:hypothetical protein FSP39_018897 [Pinctada imbricata]
MAQQGEGQAADLVAPSPQLINPNLRLPPELNLTSGNVSENYKIWKRQVEIYLLASGSSNLPNNVQTATIINCGGETLLKVYDQFTWDDGKDKNNPVDVLSKVEEYCNPRKNEVSESHRFWTVKYFEPFDNFLTELRTKASSCNFGNLEDRMIRDKIVFSTTGKMQQLLLRDDDLDLRKAVRICQSYEQANKQAQEMRHDETKKVSRVKKGQSSKPKLKQNRNENTRNDGKIKFKKTCKFCGRKHEMRKELCPAYGKTCDACQGQNHFKVKCKKVRSVTNDDTDDSYSDSSDDNVDYWMTPVKYGSKKNIKAHMIVNNTDVHFQLDCGAEINTICMKYVKKEQVRPTSAVLRMYNNTKLGPLGETDLKVTNPKNKETFMLKFIVVSNKLQSLLGIEAIQAMDLVTINNDKFVANLSESCERLGDLGEASLTIDPECKPKALPCRKIPHALKDKVKVEIDTLVKRGILVPVTKPTKWVSQMAIVHKSNGKLRICIDPQALNSALQREHYNLPVFDDILPKLQNAKIFSKLDIKEAFWHVRLDESSSELTTMITPFGRYRWARLPFGLKVSSEIFQRKLNEALQDLEGTFPLVDDIIIAGCGDNEEIAKQDNAAKLNQLRSRCKEQNIVLNEAKQEIALDEISFYGHKITSDGIKPSTDKVKAIVNMPSPTDIAGVKRFCGMVQYMSRFLPSLSTTLEPLRILTRKNQPWQWTAECEQAFNNVKMQLTDAPVLAYFNPDANLVLQTDSSKDGLGAVLLQNGKPIEYASRSLTNSQKKWAQIEKEALSVLFGLKRFDQYTFGRKVVVVNDHKPLETILKKPLSSAPRRLQDIMMELHRYNIEFQYLKGEKLVIADTLSRAFLQEDQDDRPRIFMSTVNEDISDERLDEIREATRNDFSMRKLINTIENGWPDNKSDVPIACAPYFNARDLLSIHDGLVVRGEAIVIPQSLRSDIKARLHSSHLGYDSMVRRARGTVFWPNINSDIRQIADNCVACQELKPKPTKTPLMQHDDGQSPWNKIGLDLFEIQGRNYLVSIDYYTNFIEVDYLWKTTSAEVIRVLKKQFARFGIPSKIISDGGPQFTSSEFARFTRNWKIKHRTSSPNHQRANGKAESAVKVIKHLILKCEHDRTDQNEALMEQRNTPRQDTGLSPAQMMFERSTRTLLPTVCREKQEPIKKRERRRKSVKNYYDKTSTDHPELKINQNIYFEHKEGQVWIPGKVIDRLRKHTYLVKSQDGAIYRRNRIHIRPTQIEVTIRESSPTRIENRKDHPVRKPEPVQQKITPSELPKSKSSSEPKIVPAEEPRSLTSSPSLYVNLPPTLENPNSVPLRRSTRIRKEPAKFKDFVRK